MPHGKEAKKAGIPFDFVLFVQHGFSNPVQLVELKGMDVDTIAMELRKNSTKYLWTDPETGKQSRLM